MELIKFVWSFDLHVLIFNHVVQDWLLNQDKDTDQLARHRTKSHLFPWLG